MKNSTRFLAVILMVCCSSFAFATQNRNAHVDNSAGKPINKVTVPAKMNSTPFYSEDFSGGLPGSWTAVDSAGNGVNWRWTTTGIFNYGTQPGLDSLSHSGTTASNGYMIYDSDSSGGSVGGENADLISGSIDCSAYSVVRLSFNQLLKHFNEIATVHVSNDGGTTWSMVYNASAGLTPHQATSNPDAIDIDISAEAAGQMDVMIRFNFTGDYDFFWMIDDVMLYEPTSNDAALVDITSPQNSCTGLSATEIVTVQIFNNGSADISGFDVSYVLNGGTPVTETVSATINPGNTLSYDFFITADLSVPGPHTILAYTSLGGDTLNNNDSLSISVYSGPYTVSSASNFTMGFEDNEDLSGWAIEDGNFDGNMWNLSTTLPRTGAVCARMNTPAAGTVADDWLFTSCIELSDTVSYDLEYYYRTFSTSTRAMFEIMIGSAQSAAGMTQVLEPSFMVSNLNYVQRVSNFTVSPSGTYFIGFHVTNADSATSLRLDDIRISPASGTGIMKNTHSGISIYPNPTSNNLQVQGLSNGDKIEIYNSFGQLIHTQHHAGSEKANVNLSSHATGTYIIRVIGNEATSTHKINLIR
ncbi:MAG: T9SS C-terminal target domain-containing protein [Bacteroidetes bacterium]|nr:MAG: T9SS C-terminal target domain-containing protein [Bacteroidota bacterium]REK36481.1 MAG: T9SS C-terminal target domain-containing protein [Bacteroidota bacterium]REK51695.1 MAG: T9SS C-terminal target domain-containing protein [Bacteroidota bacterium]